MKKILTGIISLVLAASMAVPAFAENSANLDDNTKSSNINVSGKYKESSAAVTEKISVDLVWDAMSFNYTVPSKGTWNPKTHEYDGVVVGGWTWNGAKGNKTAPSIKVTNNSNADVKTAFGFTSAVDGLIGSFTKSSITLVTAEGTEVANAPTDETSFSLSGAGIDANKTLGTITVTLSKLAAAQKISTENDFKEAVKKSGVFVLQNDITLNLQTSFSADNCIIDLNGHTLFASAGLFVTAKGTVTIKNGTVRYNRSGDNYYDSAITVRNSNLVLEDCEIIAGGWVLYAEQSSTVDIKNCNFTSNNKSSYAIYNESGSIMTLSGNVNLNGGKFRNGGKAVNVLPGTYNLEAYNCDMSDFVNINLYTVTKDETTGIWTVTNTPTPITTYETLQKAVNCGGTVKLASDITLADRQTVTISKDTVVTIELNGHTLNGGNSMALHNLGTLTLKNGTVLTEKHYYAVNNTGSLVAEKVTIACYTNKGYALWSDNAPKTELTDCTLYTKAWYFAVYLQCSNAKITNCNISSDAAENGKVAINVCTDGNAPMTLTISGSNTQVNDFIEAAENSKPVTIVLEDGCTLNLAEHIHEKSILTDNGDGTWTISSKN